MPAFGIPQSGGFGPPNQGLNVTCLQPGERMVLFDGTETPALGLASIAFARGTQGSQDGGSTFTIIGMPTGMTVDVQVCSPPDGGFACGCDGCGFLDREYGGTNGCPIYRCRTLDVLSL